LLVFFFFFSSRRRHTRFSRDWSSDVCSSDLEGVVQVGHVFQYMPECYRIAYSTWNILEGWGYVREACRGYVSGGVGRFNAVRLPAFLVRLKEEFAGTTPEVK